MDIHYDKVCDLILRHKESKDSIIRKTVITLIPHMAAYDPQGFCDEHHAGGTTTMMGFSFLTVSMRFLLGQLKKPEKAFGASGFRSLRLMRQGCQALTSSPTCPPAAFLSIGHVAAKVGTEMKGFLDAILTAIQDGLSQRGKKNAPPEDPIFQCIGMLARAFGPILTKHMHDLLELMFASGLGEPLREALMVTAESIKPLQRTIQDRLLDMLSIILSGKPYRPLGAPVKRGTLASVTKDLANLSTDGAPAQSQETIALALRTLSSFDFGGPSLSCRGLLTAAVLTDRHFYLARSRAQRVCPDLRAALPRGRQHGGPPGGRAYVLPAPVQGPHLLPDERALDQGHERGAREAAHGRDRRPRGAHP